MTEPFHGAKLILRHGGLLLAYRRDDRPDIPNPGLWDLPGGGREGDETPDETALRELEEEFGIRIDPARIVWRRRYPSVDHPGHHGWLLAATIEAAEIGAIRFGDEGQEWAMMPIVRFIAHTDAVPALRERVAAFMADPT